MTVEQELIPRHSAVNAALIAGGREEEGQKLSQGLAKLVLTLLHTLKELMEKQARRRVADRSLDQEQIERLGLAFADLDRKISEIATVFGLGGRDLDLSLSPMNGGMDGAMPDGGELLSLVDLLDRVIEKGVIVFGDLGISVADVELINVQLRLIVSAVRGRHGKRKVGVEGGLPRRGRGRKKAARRGGGKRGV